MLVGSRIGYIDERTQLPGRLPFMSSSARLLLRARSFNIRVLQVVSASSTRVSADRPVSIVATDK